MKRLESSFKWGLRQLSINPLLPWEEVRPSLDLESKEFEAISNEEDRIRLYKVIDKFTYIFIFNIENFLIMINLLGIST